MFKCFEFFFEDYGWGYKWSCIEDYWDWDEIWGEVVYVVEVDYEC